ncbi:MAG: hypothetical protein AB7O48_01680 [Cyclobacteriaceae bacterium]
MQELDIKEIWQTQRLSTPELKEGELETMLRRRSQSIVEKLKTFTRVEHIANIVVSILMIGYFLYKGDYAFSGVLILFMTIIVLYYKRLYNKLHAIQPTSDVHEYLIEVHNELRDFVRKYQISLSLLFTIAFGLGLYLGLKDKPIRDRLDDPLFYVRIGGVYLASLGICFLIVHLVYSSKLKKIRSMLDEMSSRDQD